MLNTLILVDQSGVILLRGNHTQHQQTGQSGRKIRSGRWLIVYTFAAVAAFGWLLWQSGVAGAIYQTMSRTAQGSKALIALDAGHGGFDPGKVGSAGTEEKGVNLAITLKLKKILERSGYSVILTRDSDTALCTGEESNKKMTDLKARVDRIEQSGCALAVSIHQNSYSAGTSGAQVFYYAPSGSSQESEQKRLAGILQNTIRDRIGDGNRRVEKGNSSYYMLKNISCPFVIVECGFLSNPTEEALLASEEYQEKMAQAIAEGIEAYLYRL